MITHQMHLNREYLNSIRSGKKLWEIRLNDEKRQKIKLGDEVLFRGLDSKRGWSSMESVRVKVVDTQIHYSLVSLFCYINFWKVLPEASDVGRAMHTLMKIYTDRIYRHGLMAIGIEVVK